MDIRLRKYDFSGWIFKKRILFALLTFLAHDGRLFTILKHAWFDDITENIPLPEQLPKCNEIVRCYLQKK